MIFGEHQLVYRYRDSFTIFFRQKGVSVSVAGGAKPLEIAKGFALPFERYLH